VRCTAIRGIVRSLVLTLLMHRLMLLGQDLPISGTAVRCTCAEILLMIGITRRFQPAVHCIAVANRRMRSTSCLSLMHCIAARNRKALG